MNNPFKKKNTQDQLKQGLTELILACAKVERILNTIDGENKHLSNLRLCLEDTVPIAKHIRKKLINAENPKKKEVEKPSEQDVEAL